MNDTSRAFRHRLAVAGRGWCLLLVLCAAWALLYGWSVRAQAQDAPHMLTLAEMGRACPAPRLSGER